MHCGSQLSLWNVLDASEAPADGFLRGVESSITWGEMLHSSVLGGRAEELRGASVLIATRDQFAAALALIELDGLARRIVLCPADLPGEHLPFVIATAGVDAICSDGTTSVPTGGNIIPFGPKLVRASYHRASPIQTEWILLTSGTTGQPKLVAHTLASLAGAIERSPSPAPPVVWSTFYDIRRYGGLQIFLRAVLTGASLVLSDPAESTADFLARAGKHGVTHISGTPSHWRRALMSPAASMISLQYVRLSGEIADQAILSHLQATYPDAKVAHAFAATEAGVGFAVNDGLAGFPADFIGNTPGVEMKVVDGSLRIRSDRTATRYLGDENRSLRDAEGFVDTGDMLELRGDRYHFVGRRDGIINVGGLKVHPEEVEAVINRHPQVRMSLVRTRKNPIMGALVVADVVLNDSPEPDFGGSREIQREILQLCRKSLSLHKVPSSIKFVPALAVAETGKMIRCDA